MSSSAKGLGSPKGKKFINLAYGFGAAIVIIGALMKLMHWPGWDTFLPLGMGAEALLFMIGAFEEPHHEGSKWDWSSVYPQLTREESPAQILERQKLEKKNGTSAKPKEDKKQVAKAPTATTPVVEAPTAAAPQATAQAQAGSTNALTDEDMKKWNESISKISKTADNLSKLSDVGDVSDSFVGKLKNAGESADIFSNAQNSNADLLSSSTKKLAENYKVSTEKFDLAMTSAADYLKDGLSSASDQLDKTMTNTASTIQTNLSTASEKAAATLAGSTDGIAASYKDTAKAFEQTFTKAYQDSADSMTTASNALSDGYKQVTDALANKLKMIENSTSESGKELQTVSKNLASINSVYQLQLNAINEELEIKKAQNTVQTSVNDQLTLIQQAVKEAVAANESYKIESEKLKTNITELNSVYGNMLSSLNS